MEGNIRMKCKLIQGDCLEEMKMTDNQFYKICDSVFGGHEITNPEPTKSRIKLNIDRIKEKHYDQWLDRTLDKLFDETWNNRYQNEVKENNNE
jgi:hypothetical protein